MNFPHPALRQTAAHDRQDHTAMLATAIARQANSRTARVMAMAGATQHGASDAKRDIVDQLIHYFASGDHVDVPPFGAFFPSSCVEKADETNAEFGVYQNASTNIKAHDLDNELTGEQSNNNLGHGASRKLC